MILENVPNPDKSKWIQVQDIFQWLFENSLGKNDVSHIAFSHNLRPKCQATLVVGFPRQSHLNLDWHAFQIPAPLVPTIKSPSDTRHFQEYSENEKLFKISSHPVYVKDFQDF